MATGAVRQVTRYDDFDITFPSIGPDAIVFQKGGRIYLLSLPGDKVTEVPIRVVTDATTLRARTTKADKAINAAAVSPTGRRVVFEARGDVVTVPAERGAVINVTRIGRRGPVSALVAGRQHAGVLERPQRRV